MPRRSIAFVVIALLAAVVLWFFRRAPEVAVVEVISAPLDQTVVASGRVSSAVQVQIGALMSGRVEATPVDAGAVVRKGQLLLRLERANEAAALAQAEALLEQARLQLDDARRQFRRQQEVFRRQVISAAQYDTEKNHLDLAENQLVVNRAALAAARARLNETVILAPADGVLLRRSVEVGDLVQPGSPVMTLAVTGPVLVRLDADERYLSRLAVQQRATVLADAFPAQPFAAHVIEIAPVVDRQRGTVELKLAVEQAPAFLLNDMTVSAEIEAAPAAAMPTVPDAALHETGGGFWVWRLEGHSVKRRAVTLAFRGDGRARIAAGTAAGDRLVVGDNKLVDGQRVRIKGEGG